MSGLKAIVLAAGKGTRLKSEDSDLPKVMRQVLGKPLLHYVLAGLSFIHPSDTVIVVGYKKEKVTEAFPGYSFAEQKEQLGTGHAVMASREALKDYDGDILVCCGDMPLVRRETYETLYRTHVESAYSCTLLSGTSKESLPYGRIVRDERGDFKHIVEEKDCTPEQKKIDELNSGVYMFRSEALFGALSELKNNNSQGEYYLTDVPGILLSHGERVGVCRREMDEELIGVNTMEQLLQVEEFLKRR